MARLIRKVNRNRWTATGSADAKLSSDCLSDMTNRGGSISFWRSQNDETKEKILIALCVSCTSIDKLDYAEIDESLIIELGIEINPIEGITPYTAANSLHVNLDNLSVDSLASLSKAIKFSGFMGRKLKSEMIDKIRLVKSELNSETLSEGIKKIL